MTQNGTTEVADNETSIKKWLLCSDEVESVLVGCHLLIQLRPLRLFVGHSAQLIIIDL